MKTMNKTMKLSAALATGVFASAASAVDVTDTFDVTATVAAACTVSAGNLDFGVYNRTLGNLATSTITANCTLGTDYSLALDFGGAADVNSRVMAGPGTGELSYQLYQEVGLLNVWGTGADANDDLTTVGTGLDVPHVVYGELPSAQNVEPGSYSNTVTVTLTF